MYEQQTSHLSQDQCEFFKKWENLVSLEEQDATRFKKELWTMGADERERKGRCFSRMVLCDGQREVENPSQDRIHQFTYRFLRAPIATLSMGPSASLLNGQMSNGDPVTISVEPNLIALARGFIINLKPDEVVVGVDHELDNQAIATRLGHGYRALPLGSLVEYRIDKDELFSGMARIRGNLAELFFPSGDKRRLKLVVDLEAPTFDNEDTVFPAEEDMPEFISTLNTNQKAAIIKVMSAHDYALILGMPGTGKTTVIAALIRQIVSMGKTVLLASYTHSAVDNVLLKLQDGIDFSILRLGNVDKVGLGYSRVAYWLTSVSGAP
jgi:DNA replication ATP-dependent helicase Dna2